MEENFVGYLMNVLDPETHRQVEHYLKGNPPARKKLETLRRALEPLAADKEIDPPSHLAFRTLARVAEYRCRPLPPAPEPAPAVPVHSGGGLRWLRRPDVLAAAVLLVVIGGLGVPGISHLRARSQREGCANNLREFHQVLTAYANSHDGNYPVPPKDHPLGVAGIVVPALFDSGLDLSKISTRCPGVARPTLERHLLEELDQMSPEQFQAVAPRLSGCYSYSLGYTDGAGFHCGPRRTADYSNDLEPVMSDRPALVQGKPGNSTNHGQGQNVLYLGGHVRYCTSPEAGVDRDNIFLNKDGKVAAGVDRWDTVLGSSADRP